MFCLTDCAGAPDCAGCLLGTGTLCTYVAESRRVITQTGNYAKYVRVWAYFWGVLGRMFLHNLHKPWQSLPNALIALRSIDRERSAQV
jgi:hypothetical protein